jgi:hypothetical protein
MLARVAKSQIVLSSWAFVGRPVHRVLWKTGSFGHVCEPKCDQIRLSERPSYEATRSSW